MSWKGGTGKWLTESHRNKRYYVLLYYCQYCFTEGCLISVGAASIYATLPEGKNDNTNNMKQCLSPLPEGSCEPQQCARRRLASWQRGGPAPTARPAERSPPRARIPKPHCKLPKLYRACIDRLKHHNNNKNNTQQRRCCYRMLEREVVG